MGRKNLDRYSDADWRGAAGTVTALIENRWPVTAECDLCGLVMDADLTRIAQARGPRFSLWGATTRCRRKGCPGRMAFSFSPPGGGRMIVMTARR